MNMSHLIDRDRCPACHGQSFASLYSCSFGQSPVIDYLKGFYSAQGKIDYGQLQEGAYELIECGECGLIFQKQVPDDYLAQRLYDEWIDPERAFLRHRQKDELNVLCKHAREIVQLIGCFSDPPHKLNFLDFGMGWGKWMNLARAFGCNAYGLEISPTRIEYVRSLGMEVVDPNNLPSRFFDFINCEQVFEHIPEPLKTLRTLQKALKPGGMIKINVPDGRPIRQTNGNDMWESLQQSPRAMNSVSPLEHINCYSRQSLVKMASLAGLEASYIPISVQWKNTVNVGGLKGMVKGIIRPFYRRYLAQGNNFYFRRTARAERTVTVTEDVALRAESTAIPA